MKKKLFTSNNDFTTGVINFSVLLFLITFVIFFPTISLSQGTWTKKTDFAGNAKYYAAGFSIGNKGYIGIKSEADIPANDFWEWDQITDTWTRKADFPGDFYYLATCFSIGNKGYVITDNNAFISSNNQLWEFDPDANIWTKKATLPSTASIVVAVGFSIGTKGYIGTGAIAEDFQYPFTSEFWEWNQETDTWKRKADFKGTVRTGAVGFSIGNKGYIGTGFIRSPYTNEFWEWDQESDAWTRKADFRGTPRDRAVGFSIGNKGYIGTGNNNYGHDKISTHFKDFWEWDQSTDAWTRMADFGGTARMGAVGFSIGNKGYIGIGVEGGVSNNYLNDFWEFNASAITGLNEVFYGNNFFYPNPAFDFITLNISHTDNSDLTLHIYNVSGELINSERLTQNHRRINIDELSAGIYFVEIKSKNWSERKKLIVQK